MWLNPPAVFSCLCEFVLFVVSCRNHPLRFTLLLSARKIIRCLNWSLGLGEAEEMGRRGYLPLKRLLKKFRDDNRHMNQFIVHSSLDMVEEVQWTSPTMYPFWYLLLTKVHENSGPIQ